MVPKKLSRLPLLCLVVFACLTSQAGAEPASAMSPVVADVTTRAFSLVWAVDEPVTSATAKVFADAAGTSEITQSVTLRTTSSAAAGAHGLGLARVDVSGLLPGTCYYAQALASSASGSARFPASPPYLQACTAVETRTTDGSRRPISNALLVHAVEDPIVGEALAGALVLVEAPALGAHPLSAFVGERGNGVALVDLNNLFENASGRSAAAAPGTLLRVAVLRGLACSDSQVQKLVRFRRVPEPQGSRVVTEALRPDRLFFADPLGDGVVDLADAQWVINVFGRRAGSCGFHPDLDLVTDGVINILDVQGVLNRFGETAPFTPRGGGQ